MGLKSNDFRFSGPGLVEIGPHLKGNYMENDNLVCKDCEHYLVSIGGFYRGCWISHNIKQSMLIDSYKD